MSNSDEQVRFISEDELDDKSTITRLLKSITEMSTQERSELLSHVPNKGKSDRREHPRQSCDLTVSFQKDNNCDGYITNLSAGGVFIQTKKKFDVSDTIKMSFTLPNEDNPLIATGKIIRNTDDGIAVKFDVTDFETGLISSLILLHSE